MSTLNLGQVRPIYKGEWDNITIYKAYDFVHYNGSAYLALQNVPVNYEPESQLDFWVLFGAKGQDGTNGVSGTDGVIGEQGEQGTQGIKGEQGLQGIKGEQGLQGIKGEHGTQGIQGALGLQGERGTQGIKGEQGENGTQGIQGIQGAKGVKGDTGARGTAGTQGVRGLQGVQGAPASLSDAITLSRSDIAASSKAISLVNTKVITAQNTANTANTRAVAAQNTANTANTTANTANARAVTAQNTANTANANALAAAQKITSSAIPLGDIKLMPFRNNALPVGWYFCNNDRYSNGSAQGQALNRLSANFKSDWSIRSNGSTINVPNMFYGGRGMFLRAVNSSSRRVGSVEHDAIPNMTGTTGRFIGNNTVVSDSFNSGIFHSTPGSTLQCLYSGGYMTSYTSAAFNASRVTRTASETRVLNVGMTPAIYLGV